MGEYGAVKSIMHDRIERVGNKIGQDMSYVEFKVFEVIDKCKTSVEVLRVCQTALFFLDGIEDNWGWV